MGKLNKFENVDVFVSLEAIMKQNTGFYQSDFEIDKKIITYSSRDKFQLRQIVSGNRSRTIYF